MLRAGKAVCVVGLLLFLQLAVDPNSYVSRVLLLSCFSVMLAVSLNIINGYAGQFSIGHAGFYAVGAYTGASLSHFGRAWMEASLGLASLPAWLADSAVLLAAVLAGALAAAVAGLVVGLPSLRLRGDYLAIATLGFGELIRVLLINIRQIGGARGFSIAPINSIFWIGLFTVGIVWLSRNLLNSRQGRALQALRDDETAASVLGINITYYKVMAFVLSATMAGCAGALYAHFDGYLQPDSFNFIRSIEIIIMVVLGGLGSTTGAVIAAVVLTVLPETLREFADYRMVIYSALLVICMLVRPQGLMGTTEFSWARVRSRGKETGGGLT